MPDKNKNTSTYTQLAKLASCRGFMFAPAISMVDHMIAVWPLSDEMMNNELSASDMLSNVKSALDQTRGETILAALTKTPTQSV